jgi:HEAT repeat-containing protein 5
MVMYNAKERSPSMAEIESIIAICVRSLEGADQITCHSLAQLAGHLLASTQTAQIAQPHEAIKKADQDAESPQHHGVEKVAGYPLAEMLMQISTQFNKTNLARKARVGIFDFYSCLFANLGHAFVENNYTLVVHHFMTQIVSNPRNSITRHELLQVRKLVGILLRDLIGARMLSEQGQIQAIQDLSRSYLKRWPVMLPGQVSPSSSVLCIVLGEIASLLQQLGHTPPPVEACKILLFSIPGLTSS